MVLRERGVELLSGKSLARLQHGHGEGRGQGHRRGAAAGPPQLSRAGPARAASLPLEAPDVGQSPGTRATTRSRCRQILTVEHGEPGQVRAGASRRKCLSECGGGGREEQRCQHSTRQDSKTRLWVWSSRRRGRYTRAECHRAIYRRSMLLECSAPGQDGWL